jgi:hypothetical protein
MLRAIGEEYRQGIEMKHWELGRDCNPTRVERLRNEECSANGKCPVAASQKHGKPGPGVLVSP